MKGWNAHMYLNVPAVGKTTVAVLPGSMVPASNAAADVAVCGCESLFVHTTEPPTGTCTSRGPNLKPAMPTEDALDAAGLEAAGLDAAGLDAVGLEAAGFEASVLVEHAPIVGSRIVARRSHRCLMTVSSAPRPNRIGQHRPATFDSPPPRE